jgi:hypothetical protein
MTRHGWKTHTHQKKEKQRVERLCYPTEISGSATDEITQIKFVDSKT